MSLFRWPTMRCPPPDVCSYSPDDEVSRYFPTLDPLIQQMEGRTASMYVQTLKNDGHEVRRLPSDNSKLENMFKALSKFSLQGAGILSITKEMMKNSEVYVIDTETARYTYFDVPRRSMFFLRMEPSAGDPNGPCALVFEREKQNASLVFCDTTREKYFCEYLDNFVHSHLLCRAFDHQYSKSYFIQGTDSTTDQAQDAPIQCNTAHDASTT